MRLKSLKFLLPVPLFFCVSFINDASFIDQKFSFRAEVLHQINQIRTKGCNCGNVYMQAVAPVVWSDKLATAAAAHAKDMFENNYFSHESLNGDHIRERFEKAGYRPAGFQRYVIGENIAAGQQSIEKFIRNYLKANRTVKT